MLKSFCLAQPWWEKKKFSPLDKAVRGYRSIHLYVGWKNIYTKEQMSLLAENNMS